MTTSILFRTSIAAGALVLALGACGGDKAKVASPDVSATPGAASATSNKIQVKDFAYKPGSTTVKVGTAVTWTFDDDVDHNVEPAGTSELKLSPDLKNGKTFSFTFTKPGTVNYRCGIHNSMTGTVVVTA